MLLYCSYLDAHFTAVARQLYYIVVVFTKKLGADDCMLYVSSIIFKVFNGIVELLGLA